MSFFLASFRKSLWRVAGAPWAVAVWVGVPVLIGLMVSLFAGGPGAMPRLQMLIVDQDNSVLSRAILRAAQSGPVTEIADIIPASADAAQDRLADGTATAALTIPHGFQSNYLTSAPQVLELAYDPGQAILPDIARAIVQATVDLGDRLQKALEPELAQLHAMPGQDAALSNVTLATLSASQKLVRVVPVLLTEPAKVTVRTIDTAREVTFLLLFLPGLMMMTVIFAAQGLAEDLWAERDMGTLQRLRSTPGSLGIWTLARMLSAALILCAVIAPLAVAGFWILGVPAPLLPLAVLWTALAGLMLLQLASLIHVLSPSKKAASLFSTLVFFPLLLIGGSFFPFENMPETLAAIGQFTPNGLMLGPLKSLLIGTTTGAEFLRPAAFALALSACLAAAFQWRLCTSFSTS